MALSQVALLVAGKQSSYIFNYQQQESLVVILAVMCTAGMLVLRGSLLVLLLLRGSLSFTSLSAVQIYDFHIFLAVYSSFHGFI